MQLSLGGTVDQIKSQVDSLSELSDDQVTELQSAIVSEFEKVESEELSPETVDAMSSLADMLDTVKGDIQRREVLAEELSARAAEATMRVKGEGEGEETPVEEAGDMPVDEQEVAPTDEPEPTEVMEEETVPEAMGDMPVMEEEAPMEAPMEEVPSEDTPAEDEEKKEEYSSFSTETSEALTVSEENSEFSTETAENTSVVETEAVIASAEGSEEVAPEETIETPIAQEEQKEQETVTASADNGFEAPADRQPVIEVSEPAKVAITAGADIPGYTAGSTINDMSEVAQAMEKRLHSLRRVNGGDGEQHIVASLSVSFPEERTLTADAESNALKVAAVTSPDAIVAAGGHQAPFEVKYDIYGLGSTTDRPVRDALPRFQADRGGIRFITPPSFISLTNANANAATVYDYANAVGVWTAAVDAAPESATKLSLTVAAATENTASTDAVTLQLQFGNLATRAYPELIARHNELALVQHAREAELDLIRKIGVGSTAVNAHVATTEAPSLIGFARDFLVQVRKASVAYRSRHRIDQNVRLKAIVPDWIFDAMAADLALSMPGDGTLATGRNEIQGYLAQSNVDLVGSPDLGAFGGQPGASAKLLEWPDQFTWYLFSEGTFLFLDGGTLDLGIIRDSSLVGTNDYKMFVETFEGIAKVGVESLAVTSTISINGARSALRDTLAGTASATVEF
jgi:hypothetical protein